MTDDPFAAYAVTDDDPFAAFVAEESAPAKPAPYMSPEWFKQQDARPPTTLSDVAGKIPGALPELAAAQLGGPALRMLGKIPGGRLLTTAKDALAEGAKAGVKNIPIIGPGLQAGVKAGRAAWKASAPPPMPSAPASILPKAAAGVKPKLSAKEIAEAMRKQYGSDQAGRMLYGPARPGLKAADRTASIKRLAPGESQLPARAKNAIDKELAASTAEEAFKYASKAPNAPAQEYIGEQLRQALLARMQGR